MQEVGSDRIKVFEVRRYRGGLKSMDHHYRHYSAHHRHFKCLVVKFEAKGGGGV
jgi:hypothetical protein